MIELPYVRNLFAWIRKSPLDDSVDRINYLVIPQLLIICAILVGAKQYVGSPIQCWIPKEFASSWAEYAEDYCYIHETYYAPVNSSKITPKMKEDNAIQYYQWVPIFLVFTAVMFYAPYWLYRQSMKNYNCFDVVGFVTQLVKVGEKAREISTKQNDCQEKIREIVSDAIIQINAKCETRFKASTKYIVLKIVFALHLLLQMWHMSYFLGHNSLWAAQSLTAFLRGRDWTSHGMFPRVTFCDFKIRAFGNVQSFSTQCVLMINMLNEKIYTCLWGAYIVVLLLTITNVVMTAVDLFRSSRRMQYFRQLLRTNSNEPFDEATLEEFNTFLGTDGLLAIRMVGQHSRPQFTTRILKEFINSWQDTARSSDIAPIKH